MDDRAVRHTPTAEGVLTTREREVAALLEQGLSNRQIAQALVISERTVAAHVSNALGKLALRSRTQLALWMLGRRGAPLAPSAP
jgi:DNA-binding NarL/FixJ family response regulator